MSHQVHVIKSSILSILKFICPLVCSWQKKWGWRLWWHKTPVQVLKKKRNKDRSSLTVPKGIWRGLKRDFNHQNCPEDCLKEGEAHRATVNTRSGCPSKYVFKAKPNILENLPETPESQDLSDNVPYMFLSLEGHIPLVIEDPKLLGGTKYPVWPEKA